MKAIFKREFRSYFHTVIGQLFIAVVMVFMGIYFVAYNLIQGYPYYVATLSGVSLVMLLMVPILTMRSFAEEKKTKTDQMLLTAPISVTEIVLGKYFAMVAVFGICMIFACVGPIILKIYGGGTLIADYSGILAFFLMVSAYIAIGMFISSLTESQILAAVGTFAVLLLLQLIDGLASMGSNMVFDFISSLSLVARFESFINQTMSIGSLVYYISVICVFVFGTIQSIQKRRWS